MFNLFNLHCPRLPAEVDATLKGIVHSLIAFALAIVALVLFWIRPCKIQKEKVKNILVIKLERIGDLVLSLAAIHLLKRSFPDSAITLVINEYSRAIVASDPDIHEIVVYGDGSFTAIVDRLRKKRFDLAIDLTARRLFFLPAFLSFFSGAKVRIGLNNGGRGFLFTNKVKPFSELRYHSEEMLHILDPLGLGTSSASRKLMISQADVLHIEDYLRGNYVKAGTIVCIHVGGSFKKQFWPAENYAAVIDRIMFKNKGCVVLVGAGEVEQILVSEILLLLKSGIKVINSLGQISLGQTMALISKCDLFIGNSSGPLHIAVARDIPTISFLSPDDAVRWKPVGDMHVTFDLKTATIEGVSLAINNRLLSGR